jgi:hypothetical protein
MRVRAWLQSFAQLPTTSSGVERAIAYLVAGLRLGTVAQMVPAMHEGMAVSPRPGAYLACWAVAVGCSVVVSVAAAVRGRPPGPGAALADMLLAAALLAAGVWVVLPEHRIGTWVSFQTGYALSVVLTAAVTRSRVPVLVGLPAVLAAYVAQLVGVSEDALITTAAGNVLTFLVYTALLRLIPGFLRRIGQEADAARAQAAELARREEQRRAQVVMHNGAAVLRLLTEPDLPAGVRAALVDQGLAELHQMRAYLHPPSTEAPGADGTVLLVDLLERTCARFTDLRIERNTGLGADVVVAEEDARAIARAVDSALLNVREHAHADLVVLHLGRTGDTWTLTIHDDGTGFDPRTVTFGVGLREVVTGELGRRGLGVVVDSAPGEGTTVSVSGRVAAGSPDVAGAAPGEARAAGRAGR